MAGGSIFLNASMLFLNHHHKRELSSCKSCALACFLGQELNPLRGHFCSSDSIISFTGGTLSIRVTQTCSHGFAQQGKQWLGSSDGESGISVADLENITEHCLTFTDAAVSFFVAEMIEAYPKAKVVLNERNDWLPGIRVIQTRIVKPMSTRLFIC